MARATLVQRIQMTGGEDIRRELEALGKEGEVAFQKLKAAAEGAGDVGTKLSQNIAALRQRFAEIGKAGEEFKRAMSDVGSSATNVAKNIAAVGVAAVAAGVAVFGLAKSASQAADDIGKAAQQTGLSVTNFQKLQFAANQSKVSTDQFIASMDRFNRNIVEAAQGNKQLATAFASIGVRLTDVTGRLRPTADVLNDVSNVFARLPDGARKSSLAIDLFGRSGAQLIPFLNQGARGIAELGAQAQKLGLVLTQTQIDIGGKLNDALGRLGGAVSALKTQLGLLFAPAITEGADRLTKLLADQRAAILSFTQNIINQALPIIRDLVAAVTGQDAAVKNIWILQWRDAIIDFGKNVKTVIETIVVPAFKAVQTVAEGVAKAINAIFGTDFDGQTVLIAATILKLVGAFTLLKDTIIAVRAAAILLAATFGLPVWVTIAGILGVAATAFVVLSQNADEAAQANEKLTANLKSLHEAQQQVKDGIPGAVENYKKLTQVVLDQAKAAIAAAQAQVDAQKKIVDDLEAQAGQDPFGGAGPQSVQARMKLNDLQQALDDAVARLKIVQDDIAKAGITAVDQVGQVVTAVGQAAEGAAAKTEGLHSAITVIRGGVAGITKEVVDLTDGVNKNFDAAAAGATKVNDAIQAILTPIAGFGQDVQQAGDGILRIFDDTGKVLVEASDNAGQLSGSLDQVGQAAQGIASSVADLGSAIDTQPLIDNANQTVTALQQAASAADQALSAIASASQQASTGWQAVTQGINSTVAAANTAASSIVSAFGSIANQVVGAIQPLATALQGTFAAVAAAISASISSLVGSVTGQINALISTLSRLQSAIAAARAEAASAASGRAMGGPIRGAGTGTSDSILSWLSNGEFVIRASAVKKYGMAFFAALNSMRMPRTGFSLGGFARSISPVVADLRPRFAQGGAVNVPAGGALQPVLIDLGGQTFPMAASGNVIDDLSRFAARKRFRASGRKPSWSGA